MRITANHTKSKEIRKVIELFTCSDNFKWEFCFSETALLVSFGTFSAHMRAHPALAGPYPALSGSTHIGLYPAPIQPYPAPMRLISDTIRPNIRPPRTLLSTLDLLQSVLKKLQSVVMYVNNAIQSDEAAKAARRCALCKQLYTWPQLIIGKIQLIMGKIYPMIYQCQ